MQKQTEGLLAREVEERRLAAECAAGRAPADLVLKGGHYVDVLARRVRKGDIAVAGARIAAVGAVEQCIGPKTQVFDCTGLFILPGLIDPHIHPGFSQVTIERFAEILVPKGTVVIGACFYESAAIGGYKSVEEQLARSRGTGLDVFLSPFHAAALNLGKFGHINRFSVQDLKRMVEHPDCIEIREWSDAVRKLPIPELEEYWAEAIRRGRVIGGHLEGVSGAALQAAAAQGVASDHEAVKLSEAIERARLGICVQIREGSSMRDLAQLLPAITEHGESPDLFSVCSDEQELHDIDADGNIDGKLRMLVENGVAPVEAVRMATHNAARSLGLDRHYGAITPGRYASLALVDNLAGFNVRHTFSRGRLAASEGRYLLPASADPYPGEFLKTMHVGQTFEASDFKLPVADGRARLRVIEMSSGSIETREVHLDLGIAGGAVTDGVAADIAKLAVADRHEASGRMAIGMTRGFGMQRGAFAATINAGLMNLFVIGVDDADMALAANRAAELDGGIVVAVGGRIVAELAMPVFGLVSHAPLADSLSRMHRIAHALKEDIGSPHKGLVPMAGFACLAVSVPSLKITDRGLVRVGRDGARYYAPLVVETP